MDTPSPVSLSFGLLVTLGVVSAASTAYYYSSRNNINSTRSNSIKSSSSLKTQSIGEGVEALIGNTPIVKIRSLSRETGCSILAKAEFLNPGGSTKDRVALGIIEDAEQRDLISPNSGCTIFEGTVGSTGIALALMARAKGYHCHIVMPDDQAKEKYALLEKLGATVEKVRPVSIVHQNHFVNLAKKRADEMNARAQECALKGDVEGAKRRGYFCDQFENLANFEVGFYY